MVSQWCDNGVSDPHRGWARGAQSGGQRLSRALVLPAIYTGKLLPPPGSGKKRGREAANVVRDYGTCAQAPLRLLS